MAVVTINRTVQKSVLEKLGLFNTLDLMKGTDQMTGLKSDYLLNGSTREGKIAIKKLMTKQMGFGLTERILFGVAEATDSEWGIPTGVETDELTPDTINDADTYAKSQFMGHAFYTPKSPMVMHPGVEYEKSIIRPVISRAFFNQVHRMIVAQAKSIIQIPELVVGSTTTPLTRGLLRQAQSKWKIDTDLPDVFMSNATLDVILDKQTKGTEIKEQIISVNAGAMSAENNGQNMTTQITRPSRYILGHQTPVHLDDGIPKGYLFFAKPKSFAMSVASLNGGTQRIPNPKANMGVGSYTYQTLAYILLHPLSLSFKDRYKDDYANIAGLTVTEWGSGCFELIGSYVKNSNFLSIQFKIT